MSEKRFSRAVLAIGLLLTAPVSFACTTTNWVDDGGTPHSAVAGVIEAGDFPSNGFRTYEDICSLRVTPNGSAPFVEDGSASAEPMFIGRFYIYLKDLTLDVGEGFTVFEAFNSAGGSELAVDITDTTGSQDYVVTVTADGQTSAGDSIAFETPASLPGPVQWSMIQVSWDAEAGTVGLVINGEAGSGRSGLNTSGNRIEYARLGDLTGLDAVGPIYFDAYASRRAGSPGLVFPGDSNMDGNRTVSDMIQVLNIINTPVIPFFGPANCNGDSQISVSDLLCLQTAINS